MCRRVPCGAIVRGCEVVPCITWGLLPMMFSAGRCRSASWVPGAVDAPGLVVTRLLLVPGPPLRLARLLVSGMPVVLARWLVPGTLLGPAELWCLRLDVCRSGPSVPTRS
jgi:hypothetical protein